MADILELIHQLLTDGVSLASLISVILVWHKIVEGNRKREAYERLESKVNAILEKENIVWNANSNGTISFPKRLRNSIMCFWADISIVNSAVLYTPLRRMRRMPQVNRVWLFTIIVFIGGMISKRMGVEFSDEVYNEVTDFIIYIALPLAGFALDKFKTKEVKNEEFSMDTDSAV